MQRSVTGMLWVVFSLILVAYAAPAPVTAALTLTPTTNATGSPTEATSTTLPPVPSESYRLYPAEGPDGPPKVSLEDRFQTEVVNLDPVSFFMVPLELNGEPILDPLSHRACYQMWTGRFWASVNVENRFGSQTLQLGDPTALCVPTELSADAPASVLRRDHYKCYGADGPPLAGVHLDLSDEFQDQAAVESLEPFWFCTPVSTNGREVSNRDAHLTCYTTSTSDSPEAPGLISVRNHFHESDEAVFLFGADGICVPSSLGACGSDEDCDDGNPCTEDNCSLAIEVCVHTAKAGSCVPLDRCSAVGQCVEGRCEGAITGVDDLVCTLDALRSVPCVQEELPKRFRKFVSRKVRQAGKSLERAQRAGSKGKRSKAEKARRRAARHLEAIPKKIRKGRWRTCRETVEALVGERRQLIQEAAF